MELDFIRWLAEQMPPHPLLKLGIGDDAAVLATAGRSDIVVTTDLIADGVDFDLQKHDARQIGHKALAINLSDLAAMAAQPLAAVVALNLPRGSGHKGSGLELAKTIYEGMLPLAERFHVAIAGGDTNSWDGSLVISVSALGEVTPDGPLRRRGARSGDRIIVTGHFGGSILGRHLQVEPRVTEALLLNQRYGLHAGIDVSDGLALDLWRLCEASSCGAEIDVGRVPIAPAAFELANAESGATSSDEINRSAREHALGDGEDFELILAVPPDSAERMLADQPLEGVPLTEIGHCTAERGLWQLGAAGPRQPLAPRGYEHRFD